MNNLKNLEVWFITGTQHLYGPETLKQVAADSAKIAAALDKSSKDSDKSSLQTDSYNPRFNILNFVQRQIIQITVLVLLPGCIPFHLPKCG